MAVEHRASKAPADLSDSGIEQLIHAKDWPAAQRAIRARIRLNPNDSNAWFYRAAGEMVNRRFASARKLFARAAALSPTEARLVAAQAAACLADSRADEAVRLCEQALTLDPQDLATRITHLQALVQLRRAIQALPYAEYLVQHHLDIPETRQLMGEVLRGLGRPLDAISWFEATLELLQDDIRPQIDIAVCVNQTGNARPALKIIQSLLDKLPTDSPEVFSRCGIRAQEAGSPHLAMQFFKRGVALFPEDLTLNVNLGITLQGLGHPGEALFHLQRALNADPKQALPWLFVGHCHMAIRNKAAAHQAFEQCIEIDPKNTQALMALAGLKKEKGLLEEAKNLLRQVIKKDKYWLQPYLNLHHFLRESDELDEAGKVLKTAAKLFPNSPDIFHNEAGLLLKKGEIEKANAIFRSILKEEPHNPDAMSGLLFCSNYDPQLTPQEIANAYMDWDRRFVKWRAPDPTFQYPNKPKPRKRIKLGYVSGDFRGHSVAFFFEPLLAHHDHKQFEIYCYANFNGGDQTTQRIMDMADHWRWTHDLPDEAVVEMIRLDEIDILIDLSNHTAFHRLYMFGRKPAPIQMTTIGMPTTTGLSAIDWRISDRWMDPEGLTESLHSEKLLRILSGWCYRPSDEARELPVQPLPALHNGYLTFASFNAFGKINPVVLTLWGDLLRVIPNARLCLATGGKADDQTLNKRIRQTCKKLGIPLNRLTLLPRMPLKEYFEYHGQVDIVLDAFPYTGATVTAHALWMGVPVITLAGPSSIHRSATSMMNSVGLTEFVASTKTEYIEIAKTWANNIPKLSAIRNTLRNQMINSPLMDGAAVTKDLEYHLRQVWTNWCKAQTLKIH